MYYPYLRAKQYELKSLREFAVEHKGQNKIIPIFEPVKQQTNALVLAINDFIQEGLRFALILNPKEGDYKHTNVKFDLWLNNENIDDTIAWDLIKDSSVDYVVNAFGTSVSRRLKSQLKAVVQNVIRLDDCFKSKVRNADYANETDELFSEEPFFYELEGQFNGYSDFTTLPSEYVEGGMLPYALAIHLSYKRNEEQIYVHHFVSDSNETNNDVKNKFREAAQKVEPFYINRPKTSAVEELILKANDSNGYPGLGYLKKLSIKNHLELILSL